MVAYVRNLSTVVAAQVDGLSVKIYYLRHSNLSSRWARRHWLAAALDRNFHKQV